MHRIVGLALVLIVIAPLAIAAAEPDTKHQEAEKKAVESADAWLPLVDQGKYGEAWDAAAPSLKDAITNDDFSKALTAARKPLGAMKSRQLKSKQYATSLPGAPDGQYVVIQYETTFENKKSAVETITPMLDKNGVWKVSGYFIK